MKHITLKKNFEKRKPFSKNWNTAFQMKVLRLKMQRLHTKEPCQKTMLKSEH